MIATDCTPSPLILLIWLQHQLFLGEAKTLPGYRIISDTTLTYSSLELLWSFKFSEISTKSSQDNSYKNYSFKFSSGKDQGGNIFPLI